MFEWETLSVDSIYTKGQLETCIQEMNTVHIEIFMGEVQFRHDANDDLELLVICIDATFNLFKIS